MGRLKVRVPAVYGLSNEIPTDQLPWALPRGMPFGNSAQSGGISWLPCLGDTVWVTFLDGLPEKPLWEWAVAPVKFASYLHKYENGQPKRAALTRYGHVLEFNSSSLIITTPSGDTLVLDEASHTVTLKNKLGNLVEISPQAVTARSGGQFMMLDGDGSQVNIFGKNAEITALQDIHLESQTTQIRAREVTATASANIRMTATGETVITAGTSVVTLGKDNAIVLNAGGRTLTISPLGFSFA